MRVRITFRGAIYEFRATQAHLDTIGALGFDKRYLSFSKWHTCAVEKTLNPSVLGQIRKVFKILRVEILKTGRIAQQIGELERLLQPEAKHES